MGFSATVHPVTGHAIRVAIFPHMVCIPCRSTIFSILLRSYGSHLLDVDFYMGRIGDTRSVSSDLIVVITVNGFLVL